MYSFLSTIANEAVFTLAFTPILFRSYGSKSLSKQFEKKINPYYITGLSDAESTFVISVYKKKDTKTKWQVQPVFAIYLDEKDIDLLKSIQFFFGVGVVVSRKATNSVMYSVNSLKDLTNVIIPHFCKFPLLTKKGVDFLLFKSAVNIIEQRKHLTVEGLNQIVSIRAAMNKGLTNVLIQSFPSILPVVKPVVGVINDINPYWLSGFVDGKCCFYVGIFPPKKSKNGAPPFPHGGQSVNLFFKLIQHSRDIELLKNIVKFLDCGVIQELKTPAVNLLCVNFCDIEEKIIPFFYQYPLHGYKRLNLADFSKVVKLVRNKSHLTPEGLEKIKNIKAGMNKGRDYHESNSDSVSYSEPPALSGSFYIYPAIVKNLKMGGNQQETKGKCLVGSSETLRSLSSNNKSELNWNQWLAGLIDGNGCFLVSKSNYTSCEITMGIEDEHALLQIKQKLGGSVKLRVGVSTLRYRLHNKAGMIDLVTRVNGHILNNIRLKQLEFICKALNITLQQPSILSKSNGWFSGFFDADGTVTSSIKNGYPQLTISITNKHKENVKYFENVFAGKVYFDKGGYGSYKWSIQSEIDINMFLDYIKKYPSISHKNKRLFLIPKYYKLKSLRAYNQELGSVLNKAWLSLIEDWEKGG